MVDNAVSVETSTYTTLASRLFDLACDWTGMTNVDLAQHIREELDRDSLSRMTIGGWRSGTQRIPLDAFLVVLRLTNLTALELMSRVVQDHPELLEVIPQDIDVRRTVAALVSLQAALGAQRSGVDRLVSEIESLIRPSET